MADNLKIIKKINVGTSAAPEYYEIGAKYDASNNDIESTYFPLTGGTVTGMTTFEDVIVIGEATLSYDSETKSLVFSL